MLRGIPDLGYWRGLGCPPRCPDPPQSPGWSIGVKAGREDAIGPEIPPEYAGQLTRDSWLPIADPADYGEAPTTRRRKAAGELVSIARRRMAH